MADHVIRGRSGEEEAQAIVQIVGNAREVERILELVLSAGEYEAKRIAGNLGRQPLVMNATKAPKPCDSSDQPLIGGQ